MRSTRLHLAGMVLALAALGAGCSAHLQTRTVQASDTYDLWSARMEHMPFVFHHGNGTVDAYDAHGNAWTGDEGTQRVEVYEGGTAGSTRALCTDAHNVPTAPGSPTGDSISAALCDRRRTVVSFNDTVRARELAAKAAYVARVRHLLLEGIWESVAQEPAPLHT